ncbi:MAG: methyl-accepting chemotaxis protein [Elainellaceae cyanobacterium]
MTQIPLQSTSSAKRATDTTGQTVLPVVDNPTDSIIMDKPVLDQAGNKVKGNTLRQQLFKTVLPLTLAPLTITSVVGYTIVQRDTTNDINQRLVGQALLAKELVGLNIAGNQRTLENIAINPLIQNLARASSEIAVEQNLLNVPPEAIEERFSQSKIIQLDQQANDYLAQIVGVEGIEEVIVTEENGFNVAYSQMPFSFSQIGDQWWQQGRAQGRWVSDPEYDESAAGFGFTVSQAIETRDGTFLGVAKAFFSSQELDELTHYLQDAGINGSQQVEILDVSSGRRIAGFSEAGQNLPTDANESLEFIGGQTVAEVAAALTEIQTQGAESLGAAVARFDESFPIRNVELIRIEVEEAIAREAVAGETVSEETGGELLLTFDFEDKRYAMSAADTVDWVAIASMDISEIQSRGRGFLLLFLVIGLALAVIGGVFTVALSRRLSAPLDNLSESARKVAAGNLDVTAQLAGTSETQTLAQTFNELVRRVRGSLLEQTRNAEEANLLALITGAKVDSSEDIASIFEQAVQQARGILAADRMVVYRFDLENWGGRIAAESVDNGLPSALIQGLDDPCIPEETREKYLDNGIYLHNNVATAQFHPDHLALLENLQVRSVLGTPIASQGQLYGLLIVHHCSATHTWQPTEINFMKRLSQQLGLAIERVTLREQTAQLAEEQRQIKENLQRNALQLLMDVDPVSQGDLTVRARVTEDEIGTVADSYNATVANLRKIVTQVQEAARQVAETTVESEASAQSLSKSAMQQAQDISEALDRAEEMANSAQLVAANAAKAGEAVQAAALTVEEGDDAMNRTVDGILGIRETVAETAKKVKRLGESSQKISNVVNLISGFAAQTNMLALNASIEASRAGEDSKGFAVVAEEVRELARQSAEATTEIEKLVSDIQAETNEVVVAMETGTEQVVSGTRLVDETRESLNKITATSRQISELVESITQATVVQTQASEAVTEVMTGVAAIATRNTEEANKVYGSFEDLNSVAKALQSEVDRFKVR